MEARLQLPKEVCDLLEALEEAGKEAYAVGGCVRDLLRGAQPDDYDITTAATPAETAAIFTARGEKVVETGLKHGTVTVIWQDKPYEITTFRVERGYADHRRPDSVRFTASVEEDLARRDFTVNAMAYRPGKGLVDPFRGENDLKQGILRCVGEPKRRFDEDALRILRLFRFAAQLDFEVEEQTLAAAKEAAPTLCHVSGERCYAELRKLLAGAGTVAALRLGREAIRAVLPLSDEQYDTVLTRLERLKNAREARPEAMPPWLLPLVVLLSPFKKEARDAALARLKTDRRTAEAVETLLKLLQQPVDAGAAAIKREMALCEPLRVEGDGYRALCRLRKACLPEKSDEIDRCLTVAEDILATGQCYLPAQLKISGGAIAKLATGAAVGRILGQLYGEVIEGKLANEEAVLRARAGALAEKQS